MKRFISVISIIILMVLLIGCSSGSSGDDAESFPNDTVETTGDNGGETAGIPDAAQADEKGKAKALVAFYSYSHNTETVAKRIAYLTGADIYEIKTVKPYPDDPYETSDISKEEWGSGQPDAFTDEELDEKLKDWLGKYVSVADDNSLERVEKGKVVLNSGYEMPVLGLGTWTLTGDLARDSVYLALKEGYRLIDTARYYGNEEEVGEGLKAVVRDGIVTREEVFITTKIVPYGNRDYDALIDESLEKLDVGYIDLLLIHQSGAGEKELQNENHIFYQNTELQEYVTQYGTFVESWYPFGGRGHTSDSFNNPVITEIAGAHGKTSAQVILRWHLQAGYIVIPGSSNPDHIAENIDVFDFELTGDEMHQIEEINTGNRYESW